MNIEQIYVLPIQGKIPACAGCKQPLGSEAWGEKGSKKLFCQSCSIAKGWIKRWGPKDPRCPSVVNPELGRKLFFALRHKASKQYISGSLHADVIPHNPDPKLARLFHSEGLNGIHMQWSDNYEAVSEKKLKEDIAAQKKKSAVKKR